MSSPKPTMKMTPRKDVMTELEGRIRHYQHGVPLLFMEEILNIRDLLSSLLEKK